MRSDDTSRSSDAGSDPSKYEQRYEDLFEYLGKHWRWLGKISWLCIPAIFPGVVVMSYQFTGAVPRYRCFVKGCDTAGDLSNKSQTMADNEAQSISENKFTKCWLYQNASINSDSFRCVRTDPSYAMQNVSTANCDNWVYDSSIFVSTVASEFNLVCENEWMHTLGNSLLMFGMLIGDSIVGRTGDLYGRRITYVMSVIILATVSTASAFSPTFLLFCALRFLSGIGACGLFLSVFVWSVENVGIRQRIICGCLCQLLFSSGASLIGLASYFIRSWRTLQLVISIPMFFLLPVAWLVPESPRWLITRKRYKQAHQVVLNAMKNNDEARIELQKLLSKFSGNYFNRHQKMKRKPYRVYTINKFEMARNLDKVVNISDIFFSYGLMIRLVSLLIVWITCVLCYYGLTFAASTLSSDFFLNYQLSILAEIPAYFSSMFLMESIGRRFTLAGSFLISGIFCLIVTAFAVDNDPVGGTVCALGGKFFISIVFATMYSYTSELFPTTVRGTITGLCSTCGRIGGILAPVTLNMDQYLDWFSPFVAFGILNTLTGMLSFALPETKGESLPASVEEALALRGKYPVLSFCKQQVYPKGVPAEQNMKQIPQKLNKEHENIDKKFNII